MQFPVTLTPDDGQIGVTFPDVPEAITFGPDEAEALHQAADALVAALGMYINDREAIPQPSPVAAGQPSVSLPVVVVCKLALYDAMRRQRLTRVALAERMGLGENQIRRLLDLDHRSNMGQLERALTAVGKRLVVDVRDAA